VSESAGGVTEPVVTHAACRTLSRIVSLLVAQPTATTLWH